MCLRGSWCSFSVCFECSLIRVYCIVVRWFNTHRNIVFYGIGKWADLMVSPLTLWLLVRCNWDRVYMMYLCICDEHNNGQFKNEILQYVNALKIWQICDTIEDCYKIYLLDFSLDFCYFCNSCYNSILKKLHVSAFLKYHVIKTLAITRCARITIHY